MIDRSNGKEMRMRGSGSRDGDRKQWWTPRGLQKNPRTMAENMQAAEEDRTAPKEFMALIVNNVAGYPTARAYVSVKRKRSIFERMTFHENRVSSVCDRRSQIYRFVSE